MSTPDQPCGCPLWKSRVQKIMESRDSQKYHCENPLETIIFFGLNDMDNRGSRSHQYDSVEEELGICSYLSHSEGFSSVMKARYSDFLVHEVGIDGTLARLETLQYREDDEDTSKNNDDERKEKKTSDDTIMVDATSTTVAVAAAATATNTVGEAKAKAATATTAAEKKEVASMDTANESRKRKLEEPEEGEQQKQRRQRQGDRIASLSASAPAVKSDTNNNSEWEEIETQLSEWVEKGASRKVVQFLRQNQDDRPQQQQRDKESSSENKNEDDHKKFVHLPPITDKTTRRSIHEWIRSRLSFCAIADTDADTKQLRVWHKKYKKFMPNNFSKDNRRNNRNNSGSRNNDHYGPRTKHDSGRKDRPPYLQFVLYKENMDTGTAVQQVTKRLYNHNNKFNKNKRQKKFARVGYAGMKDKRGVTGQFCTLQNVHPNQLQWLNHDNTAYNNNNRYNNNNGSGGGGGGGGGGNTNTGGKSVVRVGNFRYVSQPLQLGMLQGNRFHVVLRNIQTSKTPEQKEHNTSDKTNSCCNNDDKREEEKAEARNEKREAIEQSPTDVQSKEEPKTIRIVKECVQNIQEYGFINYFGTQRFGKYNNTHLVGIEILKGNYEKAIELILEPRSDEMPKIFSAKQLWQQRFCNKNNDDSVEMNKETSLEYNENRTNNRDKDEDRDGATKKNNASSGKAADRGDDHKKGEEEKLTKTKEIIELEAKKKKEACEGVEKIDKNSNHGVNENKDNDSNDKDIQEINHKDDNNNDNDENKNRGRNNKAEMEASCANAILRHIRNMRFLTSEIAVLTSLAKKPLDYKRAFSFIPKTMRMMFLHAVQSYIWNHMASYRVQQSNSTGENCKVMLGDLVCATTTNKDNDNSARGCNNSGNSSMDFDKIKVVDQADIDNNSYTIFDIVLPMIGTKTIELVPTNDTGSFLLKDLLDKKCGGITMDMFRNVAKHDKELTFPGDYRKFLCQPRNVEYDVMHYPSDDPKKPLVETDLMKMFHKDKDNNNNNNNNGKDNASVVMSEGKDDKNAADSNEVKNKDISGDGTNGNKATSDDAVVVAENRTDGVDKNDDIQQQKKQPKELLGMVIAFTLPSSAYATIALRELMKRPTSGEYQSALSLA